MPTSTTDVRAWESAHSRESCSHLSLLQHRSGYHQQQQHRHHHHHHQQQQHEQEQPQLPSIRQMQPNPCCALHLHLANASHKPPKDAHLMWRRVANCGAQRAAAVTACGATSIKKQSCLNSQKSVTEHTQGGATARMRLCGDYVWPQLPNLQTAMPMFEVLPPFLVNLYQNLYLLDGVQFDCDRREAPASRTNRRHPLDFPRLVGGIQRKATRPSDEEIVFGNAKVRLNKTSCSWECSRIEWLLQMELQKQQRLAPHSTKLKRASGTKASPRLADLPAARDRGDSDDEDIVVCCVPFKDFAKKLLVWHLDA